MLFDPKTVLVLHKTTYSKKCKKKVAAQFHKDHAVIKK